jgi:hypothetical protein
MDKNADDEDPFNTGWNACFDKMNPEIEQLRAKCEWQPIETAPKDRRIRMFVDGEEKHGRWDDDKYAKKPRPHWRWEGGYSITNVRTNQPTHWMPLPAPPESN